MNARSVPAQLAHLLLLLAPLELLHLLLAVTHLLEPVLLRVLKHALHLGQLTLGLLLGGAHVMHVLRQRRVVLVRVRFHLARLAHLALHVHVITARALAQEVVEPVLGFCFDEVILEALHVSVQVLDVGVLCLVAPRREQHRILDLRLDV